jgi:hypothetical protein
MDCGVVVRKEQVAAAPVPVMLTPPSPAAAACPAVSTDGFVTTIESGGKGTMSFVTSKEWG